MKKLVFIFFLSVTIVLCLLIRHISLDLGISPVQMANLIYQAKNYPGPSSSKYKVLVLGLDPRHDQFEDTQTTDTIILSSLDFETGQLKLISLPRDLWWSETKTKINYFYPLYQQDSDYLNIVKKEFEKFSGQSIDDVIVVTTDSLRQLVSLVNGVEVYLEKGFTDNQYPNPAYIASPSASVPIYKTITFPAGQIHLNDSNITEFVRSRKGSDSVADGGTDIGRSQRQQLVIEGILAKLKSPGFNYSWKFITQTYHWWSSQATTITTPKAIKYGLSYAKLLSHISISKSSPPLRELDPKNGVIYHPNYLVDGQWVYLPASKDYSSLRQFIKDNL